MRVHFSSTTGSQRLAYGALAGLAASGLALWLGLPAMPAGLLGWSTGAAVYLALAWWLAHRFDAAQVRARARALDQPRPLILVCMVVAVLISCVAIALLLQQVRQLAGWARVAHVALALVSLVGSWLVIHTVYAFHYAHSYYQPDDTPTDGGLQFPGGAEPDYADFMYHAYVIGMTSQVSDVQVCSPAMRRATLMHSVLAFAFNMLLLALSVNVVASSIG